jgi:hypothetical protein
MLTVKVTKQVHHAVRAPGATVTDESDIGRVSTRVVETDHVDIHILRPGELYEVAGGHGENSFAFYIAPRDKPRPEGFADEVDFWFQAFIENSAGATTEIVRF